MYKRITAQPALVKTLAVRSMPQCLETYNQAAVDFHSVQLYIHGRAPTQRQQNQIKPIAAAIAAFCQAAHSLAAFCKTTNYYKTTLHSAPPHIRSLPLPPNEDMPFFSLLQRNLSSPAPCRRICLLLLPRTALSLVWPRMLRYPTCKDCSYAGKATRVPLRLWNVFPTASGINGLCYTQCLYNSFMQSNHRKRQTIPSA